MSDEPTSPAPGHATETPPKAPRWVKALGIAIVVLALVVLLVLVLMGGEHGPGRHGG